MTTLGEAGGFKADWLDGYVAAYGRAVSRVPDTFGVLARNAPQRDKVAVVIGGGCGHYPAFGGLVGPGLADAAVIGDVFTSPSAEQVYRTAHAADGGAGVLFSYGNYAGDVMHFGLAARRLAAEGIDSRTVLVTDDIASGSEDVPAERRGVAGDFFVFKVAGAAAARGDDLDGVARLARKANDATRTFGAAFGGCTLPGAGDPLFTVDGERVALGLGIHGEPGARTVPRTDAAELADQLVGTLLPSLPTGPGDGRVAVLLNGLGRTKYEEMFVCYKHVDQRLRAAGLRPYRTEVGEFVTSLDMAGLSLSLMVLDDELAELYDASCDTPGWRSHGATWPAEAPAPTTHDDLAPRVAGAGPAATGDAVTGSGGVVADALAAGLQRVAEQEDELGRLDSVAGDGDHGQGIVRGLRAAVEAAENTGDDRRTATAVGGALLAAGTALADAAGGASGALYGVLLTGTGAALAESGADSVDLSALCSAVGAALDGVAELGGARVGEKTMLDALDPFRAELERRADAGDPLADGWRSAATTALAAAAETAELSAARGRASRLGERGRGHAAPGATSFALLVDGVAATFEGASTPTAPTTAPTGTPTGATVNADSGKER